MGVRCVAAHDRGWRRTAKPGFLTRNPSELPAASSAPYSLYMPAPYRNVLTVEDLYAMPDDGFHYELQAGLLLSEPLPGFRHGRLVATLTVMIHEHVRERGLGIVVSGDPGFVLARNPDTLRGPDIAFVAKQRAGNQEDSSRAF